MARRAVRPTIVAMETTVHEIADGVYRLSTYLPDISPAGFTMNQFLVDAEEPLLFHCGHAGSSRSCPRPCPGCCRWSGCAGSPSVTSRPTSAGAMNQWLAAAPAAQVAHGELGCAVSIADMADRPPRPLAEGEVLDIGGHRLRQIPTPHVPHAWEAQVLFDETTGTLLCGDLFTQVGEAGDGARRGHGHPRPRGRGHVPRHLPDPVHRTHHAALADLAPRTLALMHGPSFTGDCAGALRDLADGYAERLTLAAAAAGV